MAPLASLLCTAFIVWLLKRDAKRRPSLSAATWIPTLMVFFFGSKLPGVWFDLPGSADQIYFVLTVGASLIVLSSRAVKWSKLLAANAAILLFYGYFAVSFLWSSYPADSFIRIVKDFGLNIIVILVILSDKNPLEALRAVNVRCACVVIPLSMLFTRFYTVGKSYSRDGGLSYNGVGEQKNSFGAALMVFMLFLVWDHFESRPAGAKWPWSRMRWDRLALLLMGAYELNLSQSKTSLMCVLIGSALICARGWLGSRTISRMIFFGALSLPVLLFFTQQFGSVFGTILGALGRDATFTGRTLLWQRIDATTVNPLIGAGFWTFWGTTTGMAIAHELDKDTPGFTVPSAHDGYLDIYLDGGGAGPGGTVFSACGSREPNHKELQ